MVDGAAAAHVRIDLTNLLTISHFFVFAKKKKKTVKNIILDYFYKEELIRGRIKKKDSMEIKFV